ncbi:MAG: outer membrane beta-barrel domain-containing protein [Pseudobdellovibrionaceae bacterium]
MGIFIKRIALTALLVTLTVSFSRAEEIEIDSASDDDYQVNQDSEIKDVESVLEKNIPEGAPKVQLPAAVKQPRNKVDFTDLKKDSHFDDTVIIQKTYMPKTKRFQFFGGFSLAVNDAFFRTMGGQLRAGYHFNETWGLEATGFLLTSEDTNEKKDLESKQNLGVANLTTPKSFLGVNAYFSSIYGKMALEDRKIVPFEFYQTIGVGQITTNPTSTSTAFYFGLGDIFSISKNSAIRADLSWFFYNGKTINGDNQSANTIFLTIGYGRFVPEVGRR